MVMMEGDNKPVYEQRFNAAVKVIQSLPSNGSFQPSNDMMLKFYSYYKQATQGPCNIPRPGFWDPVGKAKWDAWNSLGEMPKEEAMAAYVDDLKLILESMPVTNEVEELLQIIGPFYELVDEKRRITQVSDLSSGFGSLLTSPPKSVTKSIIRTMEMNGSLDSYSVKPPIMPKTKLIELEDGVNDNEEEEEEKDDEEEVKELKKASQPKKRASSGRLKGPVSNGNISQHKVLTNGTHGSMSDLNRQESEEDSESINHAGDIVELRHIKGVEKDFEEDVSSSHHVASDSDSEVYCDSVDQFGGEEGSETHINHSLDVAEESHSRLSSTEGVPSQEELLGQEEGAQHGGEDGRGSGGASQRQGLPANRSNRSVVKRGRGSRSPASGSGPAGPQQGSGGDGERWGTGGPVMENLNHQIICALARLQEDMQSVLERLHTLEALTAVQARSLALPSEYLSPPVNKTKKKPSWWPFDVSPGTVAFAAIWPFVVQWLIRLYLQRRRRRIN